MPFFPTALRIYVIVDTMLDHRRQDISRHGDAWRLSTYPQNLGFRKRRPFFALCVHQYRNQARRDKKYEIVVIHCDELRSADDWRVNRYYFTLISPTLSNSPASVENRFCSRSPFNGARVFGSVSTSFLPS